MTADEKAKLFKAIGFTEADTISVLPPEYVAVVANFKLSELEVFIRNEAEASANSSFVATVLSFQINDVSCQAKQRPAASGLA